MPVAARQEQVRALVGQIIGGKYRIERLVGAGGMGAVYEALNLAINKRVALKFLFREEALHADTGARFQREAEAASAVESAHIVQIFDAGTSDQGRPYLVMELLDGEDLRRRLKREGKLSLAVVLRIAQQLLRALSRAHAAGIIHRDLKPDNIFICRRDDDPAFVKIVDFGISKVVNQSGDTLTREGTVLGTAHYMSPEQAQAFNDIDGRADLFSVGAILYECLAGRPPHIAKTFEAVLIRICTTPAKNLREYAPEVPMSVAAVIGRSIERERADRYQTAEAFAHALEQAAPECWNSGRSSSDGLAPLAHNAQPAFADTELSDTPNLARTRQEPSPELAGVRSRLVAEAPKQPNRLPIVSVAAGALLLGGGVAATLFDRTAAPANTIEPTPPIVSTPMARAVPAPSANLVASSSLAAPPIAPLSAATASVALPVTRRPLPAASAAISGAPGPAASTSVRPVVSSGPTIGSGVAGQLRLKTEGP